MTIVRILFDRDVDRDVDRGATSFGFSNRSPQPWSNILFFLVCAVLVPVIFLFRLVCARPRPKSLFCSSHRCGVPVCRWGSGLPTLVPHTRTRIRIRTPTRTRTDGLVTRTRSSPAGRVPRTRTRTRPRIRARTHPDGPDGPVSRPRPVCPVGPAGPPAHVRSRLFCQLPARSPAPRPWPPPPLRWSAGQRHPHEGPGRYRCVALDRERRKVLASIYSFFGLLVLTNENNKTDSTNRVIERERQRQSDCGKDH